MKAANGREKALSIALAVSILLVGVVIAWEWKEGKALEAELLKMRKVAVTQVPAQNILPEFALPDVAVGFPELVSRNLFAANRRSALPASKALIVMKKGQFTLVGVLITPQRRSALLRDVQTNKTEVVALGGVTRGLTLGEVEPSRVVLRQGTESEDLTLNVQTGPKRPSMPLAPTPSAMGSSVPANAAAQSSDASGLRPPPTQPKLL